MSLHDRIKEARLKKGLTQTELGNLIGVAKTTISGYEKNREPTAAQLGQLADVLEVDISFLLQDEIKERREYSATPAEMEIIKKYRSLDDYGKETTLIVIDRELHRTEQLKTAKLTPSDRKDNIIPLRQSRQPVSAGTGAYLGPEEFDTVFVEKNDLTDRASFAVPVRGDSMEPHYHDGDVLLVEGCEDIAVGEIGVFTVNGEGYVKERGIGVLNSLNPQYEPVQITEDSWCNGKVIGILDSKCIR